MVSRMGRGPPIQGRADKSQQERGSRMGPDPSSTVFSLFVVMGTFFVTRPEGGRSSQKETPGRPQLSSPAYNKSHRPSASVTGFCDSEKSSTWVFPFITSKSRQRSRSDSRVAQGDRCGPRCLPRNKSWGTHVCHSQVLCRDEGQTRRPGVRIVAFVFW